MSLRSVRHQDDVTQPTARARRDGPDEIVAQLSSIKIIRESAHATNDETLDDLRRLIQSLKNEAGQTEKARIFFDGVRRSNLLLLSIGSKKTRQEVHGDCFSALFELGRTSIPLGIAMTMHWYMLSAIATYPFRASIKRQSDLLINVVRAKRLLVGNSGSDKKVRANNVGVTSTILKKLTAKTYELSGDKTFMSMAGIADVAVFTAMISRGISEDYVFVVPELSGQERVSYGPHVFDGDMELSNTKAVDLRGVPVRRSQIVRASSSEVLAMHRYQRAWFQCLLPAIYLGSARECLNDAVCWALDAKTVEGQSMSELDGVVMELGRLDLILRAAMNICRSASHGLDQLANASPDVETEDAYVETALAKYHGLKAAEDVIGRVRQLVGARAMSRNSSVQKAMEYVGYGAAFAVLPPIFEREAGRLLIKRRSVQSATVIKSA